MVEASFGATEIGPFPVALPRRIGGFLAGARLAGSFRHAEAVGNSLSPAEKGSLAAPAGRLRPPEFAAGGGLVAVPSERFAGGRMHVADAVLIAHAHWIAGLRVNDGSGELAVFPFQIHGESAAGTQAAHRTARPFLRQGGQQMEFAGMGLQQHLRDGGGGTVGTIHLRGPEAFGEQVRGGLDLHLIRQATERVIAIVEAGPTGGFPDHPEAGADIAAEVVRHFGRLRQLGRCRRGDLVAGKQSVEMRDMPVLLWTGRDLRTGFGYSRVAACGGLHAWKLGHSPAARLRR